MFEHTFDAHTALRTLSGLDIGLRVRVEVEPSQRPIFSGAENLSIQALTAELAERVSSLRVYSYAVRGQLERVTSALQRNVTTSIKAGMLFRCLVLHTAAPPALGTAILWRSSEDSDRMTLRPFGDIRDALGRMVDSMLVEQPDLDSELRSALVPEKSQYSTDEIGALASYWRGQVPASLLDVIERYELGGIQLAGVTFGDRGSLLQSLLRQARAGATPATRLRIAASAGYEVEVDADGTVWARQIDRTAEDGAVVAKDLDAFVRGLGSLALVEGDIPGSDVKDLSREVGAQDGTFWSDVAAGSA